MDLGHTGSRHPAEAGQFCIIPNSGRPFHRIEKHELLHPNVAFPVSARKGREVLRGDVYDLIAAGQPERGVGARDRAEIGRAHV